MGLTRISNPHHGHHLQQPNHRITSIYGRILRANVLPSKEHQIMPLKKLTPTLIILVNDSIKNYLRYQDLLNNTKKYSDRWYVYLRERNSFFGTIKDVTGLTSSQAHDLIYNKTNTSSYWLADGKIRKEHP